MSSFWSQIAGGGDAVTPSDTIELGKVSVIYVGVTGNVTVLSADGRVVAFANAQAGSVIPCRVVRVNSTGTTATNLIALS